MRSKPDPPGEGAEALELGRVAEVPPDPPGEGAESRTQGNGAECSQDLLHDAIMIRVLGVTIQIH